MDKIALDNPRLLRILSHALPGSPPEGPPESSSYPIRSQPLVTKPISKPEYRGSLIYIPAESSLSEAPSAAYPTPRTGSCHNLPLSPYPFRLPYESSTLPSTCPHTFYFPATGSRLDKKTRHWRPSLSEWRVAGPRQLVFLWKEHHNFPIHLKCSQCAWGRPGCWAGAETGAGAGAHTAHCSATLLVCT